MKTKSGRAHYICSVKKYRADGSVSWENPEFKFTAINGADHMDKLIKSYAALGVRFEYSDLINLDEDK